MIRHVARNAARALLAASLLFCAACGTAGLGSGEAEPVFVPEEDPPELSAPEPVLPEEPLAATAPPERAEEVVDEGAEGEVSLAVAESESIEDVEPVDQLAEVVVEANRARHEVIRDLVAEARLLLRDFELQYVFTGKGKKETLRGRPVAFAVWSDLARDWSIVQLEIPRPPLNWKPGRKAFPVRVLTPGITARHVKGTGAERLMFAFSRGSEQLKVFGRKFPVFDSALIKKKKWRAVAETARPIVYLPFSEDAYDPMLVDEGREFLLATARTAIHTLRLAEAPSVAFPGEMLADVVPAEVITTLAVIEQTDDADFRKDAARAFNEVLNHYGLKRGEAYRYSVSTASAIGPMQFTDRRGNGTYSMVVRRCPLARIDPDFERGATDILNAMKAAICLFDIELAQMRAEIRNAYHDNKEVLGIFPVAAYNGGPKNVTKLFNVTKKMKVKLQELRAPGEQPEGKKPVACPCLWKETPTGILPVSIPRYNNENRWYVEKYQSILDVFQPEAFPEPVSSIEEPPPSSPAG